MDAYKKNELEADVGLGLYSMSSILVDRAEPSEALSTTTVWSVGLAQSKTYLVYPSAAICSGLCSRARTDVRGRRGAYFTHGVLALSGEQESSWHTVAEVNQGPADVRNLIAYLKTGQSIIEDIEADIAVGSENLARIVSTSDGMQVTEDRLSANHHFSNVLFNVMRAVYL